MSVYNVLKNCFNSLHFNSLSLSTHLFIFLVWLTSYKSVDAFTVLSIDKTSESFAVSSEKKKRKKKRGQGGVYLYICMFM